MSNTVYREGKIGYNKMFGIRNSVWYDMQFKTN